MRRPALPTVLLLAILSWPAVARGAPPASRPTTGNVLVLLDRNRALAAEGSSALEGVITAAGARRAGKSVPQIGLVTVHPPPGVAAAVFVQRLRALPGVQSVQLERRYVPRTVPDDPALTATDPASGVMWQWYLAREGLYRAWDIARGDGALVGVIDTGIDAGHPDLAPKLAIAPVDQQDPANSTGPAGTDQVGHGTHVASLACAATNNGIGIAGAGYDCRLVIEKTDFSDSSIAAAIVDATNHRVGALNMSFGPPDPSSSPPAPESEVRALDYAVAHGVVPVAAAADSPVSEQGDPANVVQPAGTGPNLDAGIGLDVTAADYSGRRASSAGFGSEISLAAYGAFNPDGGGALPCTGQPAGILGAFPGNLTQLELPPPSACRVDLGGDSRYATVDGTSMAAPQVAAVAAMMRVLNPYATVQDVLRIVKDTAQRAPGSGWSDDLGWGILNAGAALDAARRLDHLPPVSRLVAPRVARRRSFLLRWTGHDQQRSGLIASGIADFELFVRTGHRRPHLIARTARHRFRFKGRPGHRYVFFVIAVDRAGNRQPHPPHVITRVARPAG